MSIENITDPEDPRLEDFRDIRDRDVRGPQGRPGVFIGEQSLVVEKMLERPELVRRVLVAESKRAWLEQVLSERGDPEVESLVAPQEMLERIAGFPIHRGILASGRRDALDGRSLDDVIPAMDRPATILVLESIRNIDNIGSLFRVAAAFGVDGV
ncbi:MAG: RNA methyltransferase, partial [Planctomycetota bacterium]|nr:RNA methyltransferase [Planctomycetota bacterium]